MKITGKIGGVKRTQFTAHDRELHPECDNSEYLKYEKVHTGLSAEMCSYGVRIVLGTNYKWIKQRRHHETHR